MAPIPGAIPKAPPPSTTKVSEPEPVAQVAETPEVKPEGPPSSSFAVPPSKPMSITGKYVAPPDEAAPRSDLMNEVQSRRMVGASTTVPYKAPGPQSADSQAVDDAMAKAKDSGATQREQVLAGARVDDGKAKFDANGYKTGKDRIKDMMRDTAGKEITDANLQDGSGKIRFPPVKDASGKEKYPEQKSSWCGIYATDVWRRSGAPVEWKGSTVADSRTGKPLPQNPVDLKSQDSLKKIQPGDMITIQTLPDGTKGPAGAGKAPANLNHHALVESAVYEDPATKNRVSVPPDAEPAGGKIVGYNIREGNAPKVNGQEFDAIHAGYVAVEPTDKVYDKDGVGYSKRIQSHIELPPPVDARVDSVAKPPGPTRVG